MLAVWRDEESSDGVFDEGVETAGDVNDTDKDHGNAQEEVELKGASRPEVFFGKSDVTADTLYFFPIDDQPKAAKEEDEEPKHNRGLAIISLPLRDTCRSSPA